MGSAVRSLHNRESNAQLAYRDEWGKRRRWWWYVASFWCGKKAASQGIVFDAGRAKVVLGLQLVVRRVRRAGLAVAVTVAVVEGVVEGVAEAEAEAEEVWWVRRRRRLRHGVFSAQGFVSRAGLEKRAKARLRRRWRWTWTTELGIANHTAEGIGRQLLHQRRWTAHAFNMLPPLERKRAVESCCCCFATPPALLCVGQKSHRLTGLRDGQWASIARRTRPDFVWPGWSRVRATATATARARRAVGSARGSYRAVRAEVVSELQKT